MRKVEGGRDLLLAVWSGGLGRHWLHGLTHERRCWRRLVYWLRQFQREHGALPRCSVWRDASRR